MTRLLSTPGSPGTDPSGRARPRRAVAVAGLVAAARAAGLSLLAVTVLVLVAWASAAESGASATEAVRTAVQAWLLAHHTGLVLAGGSFRLVPLGLTALPGLLLYVAAARAARACSVTSGRGVAALTAVICSSYALAATVLAFTARTDAVRPQPVSAFVGAGAVALLAGGAGVVRGATVSTALRRVPVAIRLVVRAGAGAFCVLVSIGALLMAGSLAVHHDRLTALLRSLDTGLTGGLLSFLLCLLYLPTAVLWATSYVVGSGFAVGVGTSVAVTGTHLGATPAFPLLAALPGDGTPSVAWLVLAGPVGAGVVAGLLLDRGDRRLTEPVVATWRRVLLVAGGAGAAPATALCALVVLGGRSAGPGRMSDVGPTPWLLWLSVAAEVAVVSALTLLACRPQLVRRPAADADAADQPDTDAADVSGVGRGAPAGRPRRSPGTGSGPRS